MIKMNDSEMLSQPEIDEIVEAANNGKLQEWIEEHEKSEHIKHHINNYSVYKVLDYDLFYTNYILEKLTKNFSILRRYAYKDTYSYKKFKYFMVIENYTNIGINAVSVVGIPANAFSNTDYNFKYTREHASVFLVDMSSLSFYCTVSIKAE